MRKKLLLLLAVCMAVVVGAQIPGASREEGRDAAAGREVRSALEEVGASVSHPDKWVVERERFAYDGTHGYTLLSPEASPKDAHDHPGTPEVRVALAYGLDPDGIDERIRERIAEHPGLELERGNVPVGEKKLEGKAVGPIPGSTPSTEVYVPVDGQVYQVNVYGEKLDEKGKKLLSSLRFAPNSPSASSAPVLPDGEKAETHYAKGKTGPSKKEMEDRTKAAEAAAEKMAAKARGGGQFYTMSTRAAAGVPVYGEYQVAEGCFRADSRTYFQIQHGYGANRRIDDDYPYENIPKGYTYIGKPNYWGEYSHGSLGYGRCASTYYVNDKFAVDYPLNRGDYVFSPFSGGTVVFAGSTYSHKDYGIFVVIRNSNGKYVSMSAHLNSIAPGIVRGKAVNAGTVIGYAGGTAYGSIPTGYPHLHQAFYRYPALNASGAPYGGRGLEAVYHHYTGVERGIAPGVVQFVPPPSDTSATRTKGEIIGN